MCFRKVFCIMRKEKIDSKQLAKSKREEKSMSIGLWSESSIKNANKDLNMQIHFTWNMVVLVFTHWPITWEYRHVGIKKILVIKTKTLVHVYILFENYSCILRTVKITKKHLN